jgi:adenine-specific DNA-methyltransferase
LDESTGIPVQDIWLDFKDAHNQNICVTGYPTEKNADLLRRIVKASSNEGDLVLDCFAGSGTTLVCANELDRNWIGIDNSPEALRVMMERFRTGSSRMGDFSAHRLIQPEPEKVEPALELFEKTESGAESRSHPTFQPITDFSLWADQALSVEVPVLVP